MGMAMEFENLDFEVRHGLARLILNRPQAANAFDLAMARELIEVATICDEDPRIRVVLLTGAGRLFSAGGDLRSFAASEDEIPTLMKATAEALHVAVAKFARMSAPLVAAVNGAAAGAGMSLVTMTDIAIAAESATFSMAYTAAGLTPDGGSTYFLPRVVGMRRAKELILTNRRLSAAEALEWGIVERVVPDGELMPAAEELARSLASGPTRAFGATKKLLITGQTASLEEQLDAESSAIVAMTRTSDGHEGIAAFLEKRKPVFNGE